jgi:hypothetical protein
MQPSRLGALFAYDWDVDGLERLAPQWRFDVAGFDLFSFPSNARLIGFDLERFVRALERRACRRRWAGVVSYHEQFGALAAALLAESLRLPGTRPEAVIACQHKLHARRVLEAVAPDANLPFRVLPARYGEDIPDGLSYPAFVKPVKAAFSVLARRVRHRAELQAHTRFGRWEQWVIHHLVEPFERVARARVPEAGSAHRMLLEEPVHAAQYNLDGWAYRGRVEAIGVVDAVMYPGTQAFMRWDFPSRLDDGVQRRALEVARRFLRAVGFDHGLFNMEFFHDPQTGRLSVIEFNPRLSSQTADLYRRVLGIDAHAISAALALGADPATVPALPASAGAAASLVYRTFVPDELPPAATAAQRRALARLYTDAQLLLFPKRGGALRRDFKWLGSHRYAVLHLSGDDEHDLRDRAVRASTLLGWTAPYADLVRAGLPAPAGMGAELPAVPGA